MTEVASRADFSAIRYAQCWEDADILCAGLNIQPGDTCLSIASAGDNSLALLTADPAQVIAADLNPSQLYCLSLRMAAYRRLGYGELLQLIGSRPATSRQRLDLYRRCRPDLRDEARVFWDAHGTSIARGIGSAGKFEQYFAIFRRYLLPLVHRRQTIQRLLKPRDQQHRQHFYDEVWDNVAWRGLFRVFFSRRIMGALGRDPAFFRYVKGSVSERILQRSRHALRELDPSQNPYLQWILCGRHGDALPMALREEHFATIRDRLDRVQPRLATIETILDELPHIDRANLSDIFEYMSDEPTQELLGRLSAKLRPGGRLLYWNMLVPRQAGPQLADRLTTLSQLGDELLAKDKAWFYSRLIIEERQP